MVIVDPNGKYPKGTQGLLVEACGILPVFFVEATSKGLKDIGEVYEDMVEQYGFGDSSGFKWGTVDDKGVYKSAYEEDPELNPYITMSIPDGLTFHIYPNSIVGLVDPKGETIISRMD